MNKINSYIFLLYRFQRIMELCTTPSFFPEWSIKDAGNERYKMCKEYQKEFGLQAYPIYQI